MTRDELRKHCEKAVLSRAGRRLGKFDQRMLEEHDLVLDLLKETDIQKRALTLVLNDPGNLNRDEILEVCDQVLQGKEEYLKELEEIGTPE